LFFVVFFCPEQKKKEKKMNFFLNFNVPSNRKTRSLTSIELPEIYTGQQEESRKMRVASRAPKEWLYSTKTVFF
jgi:hypothetical protein